MAIINIKYMSDYKLAHTEKIYYDKSDKHSVAAVKYLESYHYSKESIEALKDEARKRMKAKFKDVHNTGNHYVLRYNSTSQHYTVEHDDDYPEEGDGEEKELEKAA